MPEKPLPSPSGLFTPTQRGILRYDLHRLVRLSKKSENVARNAYRQKMKVNHTWEYPPYCDCWMYHSLCLTLEDWNKAYDLMATENNEDLRILTEAVWSEEEPGYDLFPSHLLSEFIIKSVPPEKVPALLKNVLSPREPKLKNLIDPISVWRAVAEYVASVSFKGSDQTAFQELWQKVSADLRKVIEMAPTSGIVLEKGPVLPSLHDRVDYSSQYFGRIPEEYRDVLQGAYDWLKGPNNGHLRYPLGPRKSYDGRYIIRYEWDYNIPALFLIALKDGFIKKVNCACISCKTISNFEIAIPKENILEWTDVTKEIIRRFNHNKAFVIFDHPLLEEPFMIAGVTFRENVSERIKVLEDLVKERTHGNGKLVDFVLSKDVANGLSKKLSSGRGGGAYSMIEGEVQKLFDRELIIKSGPGGRERMELTNKGRILAQLLASESMGDEVATIMKFDVTIHELPQD